MINYPLNKKWFIYIKAESEINRDVGEIYAQRNNIDNLRTLSNQKISFDGKLLAGKVEMMLEELNW